LDYRILNRDKINKYAQEYRNNNRDLVRRRWVENRKLKYDKYILRERKKAYNLYHKNINFKIAHNLRARLRIVLKRSSIPKTQTVMDLVGCSIQELKKHLELQFKPGMNWDNYNHKTWHIDHMIPCVAFNLADITEQKKCFHYTNLQPLWAKENLVKHTSYDNFQNKTDTQAGQT